VIRVLTEKIIHPAEFNRQIVEVYGEGATNEGDMRKSCRLFKESRTMSGAAACRRQYTLITRTVQEENFQAPPPPPTHTHTQYSSYLASRDYHLKKFLASQILRSDQETKDALQDWLEGLATSFLQCRHTKAGPAVCQVR